MALCTECSHAMQEFPGSIPGWDATFSDALCRGCRWPWSSPYIVVWWPRRDAQFSRSDMHSVGSPHICYTQPNHVQPRSPIATWGGAVEPGLPAGLVQGRFSENRPFWKNFGLGKLPALWPALSGWEALNVLKRYRKKIFHKTIIFTAVKVLWQTF